MRGAYQFAFLIVVASMAACFFEGSSYEGDGDLTDRGGGILAKYPRYVLDLGPVDLTHRWRREYTMANLPAQRFIFGLRLAGDEYYGYRQWSKSVVQAKVRLVLTNEKGEVVFDVVETLSEWDSAEHTIPGADVPPRRTGRYRLLFETVVPDANASKVTVTLMAHGGGLL